MISPSIALTFSDGYAWCVDEIKTSTFAELASDLEINKAIQYLRQRDLSAATEVLKSFEKKESKVASAAATNLSFLFFLVRNKICICFEENFSENLKKFFFSNFYKSIFFLFHGFCVFFSEEFLITH